MDALKQDILTEAYEDLHKWIYKTVWDFGGYRDPNDVEEMISTANLAFLEAFDTYQESLGSLTNWMRVYIIGKLKNRRREEQKQRGPLHDPEYADLTRSRQNQLSTNWIELLNEISEDAQTVLSLLFDPPDELIEQIREREGNPDYRVSYERNFKILLKHHLEKSGWVAKRIKETFSEIKQAIIN